MIRNLRTVRGALVAAALLAPLAACSTDSLLSAKDPDLINPSDLNSPEGAEALRVGAFERMKYALFIGDAGQDGVWNLGGLLADEWKSTNTFTQTNEVDQRATHDDNSSIEATYRNIGRARGAANFAITSLRQYAPKSTTSIGQMYFARGTLELMTAETFCSGFAFSNQTVDPVQFGERLTTEQGYGAAIASFDSALAAVGAATGTDADRVRNGAQVGKARARHGQGKTAEAAAAVAGVPSTWSWDLTFLQTSGDNGIWALNNNQKRYSVSDTGDARNALPFVRAKDPRVPTIANGNGFDAVYTNVAQQLWPTRESAVSLVSGTDARLIEAEAALKAGNYASALATINALRAKYAGLAPLTDPGSDAARVEQFFREKGFFQFGRGFRLGDLRREIRLYGRTADQVFPSGNYFRGGSYGPDVNLPIPQAEQNNPNYRGAGGEFLGCLDRKA